MRGQRLIGRLGLAAAGLSVLCTTLVSCEKDEPPLDSPTEEHLVFVVVDDAGQGHLLTVAADGSVVGRLPFEHHSGRIAGRHIAWATRDAVWLTHPSGADRRQLYRASEGRELYLASVSPDGSTLAVTERLQTGQLSAVVLVDVGEGVSQRFEQSDATFDGFVGWFEGVLWHGDGQGITITGGGVGQPGNFRRSFAAVRFGGHTRVTVAEASSLLSPDGQLMLETAPATPGCMGFISSHQLVLRDLVTGEVSRSYTDERRGLRPADWFPFMAGPSFVVLSDAGCHPSEPGDTVWELPIDGSAPRLLDYDLGLVRRPSLHRGSPSSFRAGPDRAIPSCSNRAPAPGAYSAVVVRTRTLLPPRRRSAQMSVGSSSRGKRSP